LNGWSVSGRGLRACALLTLLLGAVLWAGPALLRVDIIDDDANQHIYWLYRYADATLFPHDITVEYFRTSAPFGYRALYALLAPFMDVLLAAKLVSVVLFLLSGLFAWLLATSIEGPARELRGLAAVTALALLISVDRNAGGVIWPMAFQRSFALPLLLAGCWCLQSRRYLGVGLSCIGAALFYPVLLAVLGLTAAVLFVRDWMTTATLPRQWLGGGMLGAIALPLAFWGLPRAPELEPAYSYAQAIAMPEFGPHGRLQLYAPELWTNLLRFHMTGIGWPPLPLLAIMICVTVALAMGQRRLISPVAWMLLAAGLGLWLAMRLFPQQLMFALYLPNRHARWAVAVFGVVAAAAAAGAVFETCARRNRLCTLAALLGAPVAVLLVLWPHASEQLRAPVDRDLENVYAYLESLPKDTLVAAHPDLADYIPLRSRRSVLGSTEASMPWMAGFYAVVKPRVEASLRAAYATDIASMDRELAPARVKVFVTGPQVWLQTRYFDPYDSLLQQLLARGASAGFALRAPPVERVLFRSGDYYVLRVAAP
jgi:hypothetical protein